MKVTKLSTVGRITFARDDPANAGAVFSEPSSTGRPAPAPAPAAALAPGADPQKAAVAQQVLDKFTEEGELEKLGLSPEEALEKLLAYDLETLQSLLTDGVPQGGLPMGPTGLELAQRAMTLVPGCSWNFAKVGALLLAAGGGRPEPVFTERHLEKAEQFMREHPGCDWADARAFALGKRQLR